MTAVVILSEALARGGKVVWDPPDKPRLLAPPSLHEALKADRETVKEILRRAAILREQAQRFLTEGKVLPILALPKHQGKDGCLSCGGSVEAGHWRCEVCTLAVKLAKESLLSPSAEWHSR